MKTCPAVSRDDAPGAPFSQGQGGLFLPFFGDAEQESSTAAENGRGFLYFRAFYYFLGLLWFFLGVSIIADVFMAAIETITSKEKTIPGPRRRAGSLLRVVVHLNRQLRVATRLDGLLSRARRRRPRLLERVHVGLDQLGLRAKWAAGRVRALGRQAAPTMATVQHERLLDLGHARGLLLLLEPVRRADGAAALSACAAAHGC